MIPKFWTKKPFSWNKKYLKSLVRYIPVCFSLWNSTCLVSNIRQFHWLTSHICSLDWGVSSKAVPRASLLLDGLSEETQRKRWAKTMCCLWKPRVLLRKDAWYVVILGWSSYNRAMVTIPISSHLLIYICMWKILVNGIIFIYIRTNLHQYIPSGYLT